MHMINFSKPSFSQKSVCLCVRECERCDACDFEKWRQEKIMSFVGLGKKI